MTPRSLTEALNLSEDSLQDSTVVVVWGEGSSKNPYDLNRYHAGHLSALCTVCGLRSLKAQVGIVFTGDRQRHKGPMASLYEERKTSVQSWIRHVVGNQVPFFDVPALHRDTSAQDPVRRFWSTAGGHFADLCNTFSQARKKLSPAEEAQWKHTGQALAEARQDDSMASKWTSTNVPSQLWEVYATHLLQAVPDYPERSADAAATAYLAGWRVVEEDKWKPNEVRNWIEEVGSVLCMKQLFHRASSSDGGIQYIVEASRNMYWLRCLRLMGRKCTSSPAASLPKILPIANLSDTNGVKAMMASSPQTCLHVLREPADLHSALKTCSPHFLRAFGDRLGWATQHGAARDLASTLNGWDSARLDEHRNAIFDVVTYLGSYERMPSDRVHVDDWYCVGYLAQEVLELTNPQRWKESITAGQVNSKEGSTEIFTSVAQRLAARIQHDHQNKALGRVAEEVSKICSAYPDMDLLSHMTGKRYRDHGRHQVKVAAIGHLFLRAAVPETPLVQAERLAEKVVTERLLRKGGAIGAPDREKIAREAAALRDAYLLAALVHDHAYPLVTVGWLLCRLHTMVEKGGRKRESEALAHSLREFVAPFSSPWFEELCNKIQTSKSEPHRVLLPGQWEPLAKGWAADLDPGDGWRGTKGWRHGLVGAINLWSRLGIDHQSLEPGSLALQVLGAIAAHDDVAERKLELANEPLAFLLLVADEIQEWQRRMFWEGEQVVESRHVDVKNISRGGRYDLQFASDELKVHFVHVGPAQTAIPWEYDVFRKTKKRSLERLQCDTKLFPRKVQFEVSIGP